MTESLKIAIDLPVSVLIAGSTSPKLAIFLFSFFVKPLRS
jgi:hypothetical protein